MVVARRRGAIPLLLLIFAGCFGGGFALAGPGLWARWAMHREIGSVLSLETAPVDADQPGLVALEVTFLFESRDGVRQISYGICDAFGAPLPDPVLSQPQADAFIDRYWRHDRRRYPVYYDPATGPTSARLHLSLEGRQDLLFQFGLLLLLCPIVSLIVTVGLARWRLSQMNRRRLRRDR